MVFLELPHMAAKKKPPKEQKPTGVSAGAFAENAKQEYMAPSMKYVALIVYIWLYIINTLVVCGFLSVSMSVYVSWSLSHPHSPPYPY